MLQEKIGIIGAGKIGSAIVRGVISAGLVTKDQVMASDVSDALRQSIAKDLGIEVTPDNGKVCDFADTVILAVKPQIVDAVLKEVAQRLGKSQTFDLGCRGCSSFPTRSQFGSRGSRCAGDAQYSLRGGSGRIRLCRRGTRDGQGYGDGGIGSQQFWDCLTCGRKVFGRGDRA